MKFKNSFYLFHYNNHSNMQQTEEVQHIRNSTDSDIPGTSMDVTESPASCEYVIETQSENNIPP